MSQVGYTFRAMIATCTAYTRDHVVRWKLTSSDGEAQRYEAMFRGMRLVLSQNLSPCLVMGSSGPEERYIPIDEWTFRIQLGIEAFEVLWVGTIGQLLHELLEAVVCAEADRRTEEWLSQPAQSRLVEFLTEQTSG